MDETTTVLTIDLPGNLGDRLRQVLYQRPESSARDIAVAALEEWLDRYEAEGETHFETQELPASEPE